MTIRQVFAVAALASLAGLAYFDRRELRGELATLRAEMAAITAATRTERVRPMFGLAPDRRSIRPPEFRATDLATTAGSAPPRSPSRAAPSPPSRVEEFAPIQAAIEASYLIERTDPGWAAEARGTVENRLAGKLPPDSRIDSIECRSTICRIRSVHPNQARSDEFLDRAVFPSEGSLWQGEVAVGLVAQQPDDGAVIMVTYLGREGYHLPAVPDDSEAR